MNYEKKSVDIESISRDITDRLIGKSVRPVVNPDQIRESAAISLQNGTPLRCRMVLCPNWQVTEKGRTIGEIPVAITPDYKLDYPDPSMKIIGLLTEEVPNLINYLNKNGIKIELLVILADILSTGWVHDTKDAKTKLTQNQKAIKLLLMSSEKGKEVFNDKEKTQIKVESQLQLATNTEGYQQALNEKQMQALQVGTPMYDWYITVVKQIQNMGEYADQRITLAGMRKIWERALFLAGMYELDGKVFKKDFETAGFNPDSNHGYIGLGTVATPHGDIIAQGWNLNKQQPIGVVTPFNNAMEHSWSEDRKQSITW